MILWLRGDGGNDYLRSRFRDSSGQVFQVDLGQLGRSAWRPVTIPLDGPAIGAHWGGRGDGVIHPPLVWEGLILIDSAHRDTAHSGEVLLAAPAYVFGE